MSTEPGTRKMNCTQCGAGLDVLGGGRVRVHICSYCGSELDVQDDYKVIQQFRDLKRPETPFDLGMVGMLWDVPFTVIGTMAWEERYGGQTWNWVDHQIFSPTHGYAWLTVEDGFVTFARKTRDMPMPALISTATIENSEKRPTVRMDGKTWRYYGSGTARPTFIEGEFNYRPNMHDQIGYVSLVAGERMLDIVTSAEEREYEIVSLPDQWSLFESFGVDADRIAPPRGPHVLQPLDRTALQYFVRNLAIAAAVVALVLGLFFLAQGERVAQSETVRAASGVVLPFEITTGNRLTQIEVWMDAYNSWAWFEAELLNAEGEAVAAYEDGVEYYAGREGGESWSEGSQRAKTRLHLPEGRYTLEVSFAEGQVDWARGKVAEQLQVTVKQGLVNAWWMLAAALFFAVIGGAFLFQRAWHEKKRWAGSDWSDE